MNLFYMCLTVVIKHDIKVNKCYVLVNKLLNKYKNLEVENINYNLIKIKCYLEEITHRQSIDLIKKYFDDEEIVCLILKKYFRLFYFISDRLKNKKKNNFNCCSRKWRLLNGC